MIMRWKYDFRQPIALYKCNYNILVHADHDYLKTPISVRLRTFQNLIWIHIIRENCKGICVWIYLNQLV